MLYIFISKVLVLLIKYKTYILSKEKYKVEFSFT
jgi:hypothetical protein